MLLMGSIGTQLMSLPLNRSYADRIRSCLSLSTITTSKATNIDYVGKLSLSCFS